MNVELSRRVGLVMTTPPLLRSPRGTREAIASAVRRAKTWDDIPRPLRQLVEEGEAWLAEQA